MYSVQCLMHRFQCNTASLLVICFCSLLLVVLLITAWMPGPSIGGRVIDSTCLIWKTASNSGIFCGQYDIVAQRYKVHQVMLGFRCSCILVLLVAAYVAKKQPHWRKDEETVVTQGKEKMTNGQTCNDDDL